MGKAIHAKIANKRKDDLHKYSRRLVDLEKLEELTAFFDDNDVEITCLNLSNSFNWLATTLLSKLDTETAVQHLQQIQEKLRKLPFAWSSWVAWSVMSSAIKKYQNEDSHFGENSPELWSEFLETEINTVESPLRY